MKNNEEFRGILSKNIKESKVILTGIPIDKNASIGKGSSKAPNVIRKLSKMVPATSKDGYLIENIKLFDNGNIKEDNFNILKNKLLKLLDINKFNLFLGGDHSIAIATERAFIDYAKSINKEPVVIHIDAHPDICDIYEDNYESHATPNKRSLDYGLKDENLLILGVRGFEEQEINLFRQHPKIDVFNANNVKKIGSEELSNYIINKYKNDKYLVHISYDIDVNDPSYAPGTGTPEPFGLDNITVIEIISNLILNLKCISFDLVEVSPKLDINNITSYLAIKTIYEIIYCLSIK